MSSAADRMACHAEQRQDQADNQYNDSDGPDNCDMRDESDDEKDDAEDYQFDSLGADDCYGPRLDVAASDEQISERRSNAEVDTLPLVTKTWVSRGEWLGLRCRWLG